MLAAKPQNDLARGGTPVLTALWFQREEFELDSLPLGGGTLFTGIAGTDQLKFSSQRLHVSLVEQTIPTM